MTNKDLRYGYSAGLTAMVEAADPALITTRFAKFCIANGVSVAQVCTHFGVSRPAVYDWFKGRSTPLAKHQQMMETLMASA
jgi:hypothetical protein